MNKKKVTPNMHDLECLRREIMATPESIESETYSELLQTQGEKDLDGKRREKKKLERILEKERKEKEKEIKQNQRKRSIRRYFSKNELYIKNEFTIQCRKLKCKNTVDFSDFRSSFFKYWLGKDFSKITAIQCNNLIKKSILNLLEKNELKRELLRQRLRERRREDKDQKEAEKEAFFYGFVRKMKDIIYEGDEIEILNNFKLIMNSQELSAEQKQKFIQKILVRYSGSPTLLGVILNYDLNETIKRVVKRKLDRYQHNK